MRWALLLFFVACGPFKPEADAGTPSDASTAKDVTPPPCTVDYGACTPSVSTCCTPGNVCASATHVCQPPCTAINGLCSDNSQCCSGICNGTCQ